MVFGMMAAVSQDLPAIYNFAQYKASKNSEVFDASGEPIGTLTSDQNKILLNLGADLAQRQECGGLDRGLALLRTQRRRLPGDRPRPGQGHPQPERPAGRLDDHRAVRQERARSRRQPHDPGEVPRGGARLPARAPLEQGQDPHRVPEHDLLRRGRLRDRGRGAHLLRRRPPRLRHPRRSPAPRCWSPGRRRRSPGSSSRPRPTIPRSIPKTPSAAATWCWKRCTNRATSPRNRTKKAASRRCRPPSEIDPPKLDSKAPYFTAYLRQQLVERYGAAEGLLRRSEGQVDARPERCRTRPKKRSTPTWLPARDRLGGRDRQPQRRRSRRWSAVPTSKPSRSTWRPRVAASPGSSIKPFTLITALEEGISPRTVYESAPQEFHFGKHGKETFVVHNDEDSYLGSCSIICATTYSDNSIYAQLGLEGLKGKTIEDRTRSIASTIHEAGYDDPISTNPAMVLGGLNEGVTPLGWAYAYSTIGNNGDRVSGTLAPRAR